MASKESSTPSTRALLARDVIPSKYYIHLIPDLTAFTFHGEETIEVEVMKSTSTLTIHALDMKINSVNFKSESQDLSANSIKFDEKSESVTFDFPESLKEGKAKLNINYDGNLNDKMVGFYRSKYFVNGETRYMATSQCEPTGARRAFPGWDEPAHKAVFQITITADEHLTVLSNMEVANRSVSDKKQKVEFKDTPKMSTYLAAFIVGEFDHVQDKTKEGTVIRVFTPLGKSVQGQFSLDVAVRCLSYYNDYYGIQYPLNKLDMIAIPDFSAGAMENWGLVTYRETALLIDEKNSGIDSKQRVAYVVAHELAHQWFGNLVTMEWWKELWLNEGFATFVGNQAVDFMFPEWDIWVQFVSGYFNRAQSLDSLENSHPIEVEVYSSAQIDEIFDAISYCKGASVIRMISDLIGEDKFKKGLNIYLNRFAYKNAVTEDLWNALSEASGFPVKEFMDPWTKKTGYPLVTIESTSNNTEFKVKQQRFFGSGKTLSEEDSKEKWWINIGVVTNSSKKPTLHDFKSQSDLLSLPEVKDAQWFKLNGGQSGFYRVKYSTDISLKLREAISSLALAATDRIGIQNDAFALSKAGLLTTVEALTLAQSYSNEIDYTVWSDLASNLARFSSVWSNEDNHGDVKRFIRTLFKKIGNQLGWEPKENENALQALLRATVLNQLGSNDDESVINEAKKRFNDQVNNNVPIPADIRALVYKIAVVNGGEKEYEEVYKIFKTADLHEEKLRALRALGYTQDQKLLLRTLNMALNDEVRSQDIYYVTAVCGNHKAGRELTWNFFRDNFKQFEGRLKDSMMLFERVVTSAFDGFTSEEKANEVQKFFENHPVESADRGIKQSLEVIRANAKWIQSNRLSVAEFLKQQ